MNLQNNHLAIIANLKRRLQNKTNLSFMLALLLLVTILLKYSPSSKKENQSYNEYLAKIKIEGVIIEDSYRSEILSKIANNPKIKGLIVEVDSPGGSIVGSEIIYEELRKIANKKPITIIMNSLAASGGYMISLASDYIIARNGTITGSIGVIMQSTDFTDLAEKFGVKFNNYKSAPLKGVPSPFEKTTAEAEQVINESIADSYDFFRNLVISRRGKKLKDDQRIFDGRVFTGRQALSYGLVDEIGGIDQALIYLQKKYNLPISKLPLINVDLHEEKADFIDKIIDKINFGSNSKIKIFNNSQILAIYR